MLKGCLNGGILSQAGKKLAEGNLRYTPTLKGYTREAALGRKKPWKIDSYWWISIIGGILPLAVIGYINGRRLGASKKRQMLILSIGCLGLSTLLVLLVPMSGLGDPNSGTFGAVLAVNRFIAVFMGYAFFRLQNPDLRMYWQRFRDDENPFGDVGSTGMAVTLCLLVPQEIIISYILTALT